MNDTDALIARAEDSLASAKRSFDQGFDNSYPFALFKELLVEVKRLQERVDFVEQAGINDRNHLRALADIEHWKCMAALSQVLKVRGIAESHIGAPCNCNAIAYQIIAALNEER